MEYILIIFALMLGFMIAWLIVSRKLLSIRTTYDQNEKNILSIQAEVETQKSVALETVRLKTEDLQRLQLELSQQLEISNNRGIEVATLNNININLVEKLDNQKNEIESLQKRLTTEFENIATRILKERSDEFSINNHKNLSEILNPLKERIQLFEKKE